MANKNNNNKSLGQALRENPIFKSLIGTIMENPQMHSANEWVDLFSSIANIVNKDLMNGEI